MVSGCRDTGFWGDLFFVVVFCLFLRGVGGGILCCWGGGGGGGLLSSYPHPDISTDTTVMVDWA